MAIQAGDVVQLSGSNQRYMVEQTRLTDDEDEIELAVRLIIDGQVSGVLWWVNEAEVSPQARAVADVLHERRRQEDKWGEQNHDPFTYLTVLMEEVGELSQAALHSRFGGPAAAKLREEAIHTAAVALAIVECLDREKWVWPITDEAPETVELNQWYLGATIGNGPFPSGE